MNEDDIDFIRAMIEHHRTAIDMATTYLDKTSPRTRQARVAEWAREIASGQADEIKRVTGWLRAAGEPVEGDSRTGSMSGMSM